MEPKLKPKINGPLDKFFTIKKERDNQDGQSSQPPNTQPVAEEKEPHETHSFEWCSGDKKTTNVTCDEAGTVEVVLMGSLQFRETAEKNKNKELVIVRDGKAISSHFPCNLIASNERLTVKYIKAVDKLKQSVTGPIRLQRKRPSGKIVMFHLLTKGGKNVVKIMRNPELKKVIQEITVYAYKGEKVKQALKRDGRLLNIIFKKNCVLSQMKTEVTTELSNLVNDLDGKTFQIILLNKSSPPESQPGSLDDADMIQNESQRSDSDGNQDPPQQSTSTESVKDNEPKEKPNGNISPGNMVCEIPHSETMQRHLSSQFKDWVKGMKTQPGLKLSRIQNLFRVEFGKSDETCREVKTMKKLMELSNSVCQVRTKGRPEGSGFLLFDRFVLTNGHVVEKIFNDVTGQLTERVTVHFSHESLDQMEESAAEVEELVGFEHYLDNSGHEYDWALLKLGADQMLPDCLLKHFGFLPPRGGICIIGHPYGGVKKIDPCVIIQTANRNQVLERHFLENPQGVQVEGSHYSLSPGPIQLLTNEFFPHVAKSVEQRRQALTYESCFYFGSSGSPVFDEHCNVVAMHSGGYAYNNARGQSQSVIEFGHPLSVILERIIFQIVERKKFDVLKAYLTCDYSHQQNMMTGLKRLVESRNPTSFKNAVNNSVVTNDESLKKFFQFLSQTEEPVPMDTDCTVTNTTGDRRQLKLFQQ